MMPRAAVRIWPVHLWLCLALLGAGAVRADNAPPPAFSQGNALYAAGDYSRAAAAYESVVRSGIYSANLFFNLGHTYARQGQRGRAVLNYRRALTLDPADPEARASLASLPGHPTAPDGSWLNRHTHLPDIDLWTIAAAAAGLLGWAALCLGHRARWRLPVAALGLAVCLCCTGAAWRLDGQARSAASAIVVSERIQVLDTPAVNSKAITNLPAGSEVRVLSSQGAWVYAQLADGARGWLAASAVEKVIPPVYGSTK